MASSSSFASVWRQLQVLPLLAQLPALRGSFPRFSAALAGWAEERVSSGDGPRGSEESTSYAVALDVCGGERR